MRWSKLIDEKAKQRMATFAFDWYASGFHPWRIPLFMVGFGVLTVFFFSFVNLDTGDFPVKNKRPETVYLLNSLELSRLTNDPSFIPLTRRGPVWADPVSSGVEGERYFPLHAGLSEKSSLKTLAAGTVPGGTKSFIGYLALPAPDVDRFLLKSGDAAGPLTVIPVFSPWSEELEGYYYESASEPLPADLRGMRTLCWVRVSELGVPVSVIVAESCSDGSIDDDAVNLVRQLRWLPLAGGRKGMMAVDWKEAAPK